MFYLMMYSTHFIYGYMASDMVKDSERGNVMQPLHGLLFPNRSDQVIECLTCTFRASCHGHRDWPLPVPLSGTGS